MRDGALPFPVVFPSRNDQSYTLKEFFDNVNDNRYTLPCIVNIRSLNHNCGRSIKNILSKNTPLLLLDVNQIDSILAEYYRSQDGHYPSQRNRMSLKPGKMGTKGSSKFPSVKKLSKSLATLTTISRSSVNNDDDDHFEGGGDDDDDDNNDTYKQRTIVKNLNENRSSSIPLCRVPIKYKGFFELLNENNKAIEPYHKLGDVVIIEPNIDDKTKPIKKWPSACFLRSSCIAYKEKSISEFLPTTTRNDQTSSATSVDSCYGSSSDLDSHKNSILLNDESITLQPGQILTIINDCYAVRARISDKELKEQQQQQPPSPSPTRSSSKSWIKSKSFLSFFKKRRSFQNSDSISNEIIIQPISSVLGKSEIHLKCRTEHGDIIFISLNEYGLFSPLSGQAHRLNSNTELDPTDISGVHQLKDLLSNFCFPISVRLIDGSISFDNIYSPATINRHESPLVTPSKFRLLMPYNECVVFACPLNLFSASSKSQKIPSASIVIPLSINADIEIQPCLNMNEISRNDYFIQIVETCSQIIEQYQTELSLIHFPLQLTNYTDRRKQPLFEKRSQSESRIEYCDQAYKNKFRHSDEHLNNMYYQSDESSSKASSPLRCRDSIETIKQKISADADQAQSSIRRSGCYTKIKIDKQKRHIQDEIKFEDEIFEDVDKIYDYIRTGNITEDVQKIQDKEQAVNMPYTPSPTTERSDEQHRSSASASPGKMVTHRFLSRIDDTQTVDKEADFHSCKNHGYVDEDQAHALFLESKKQHEKKNLQVVSNSKPITKMKKITKH